MPNQIVEPRTYYRTFLVLLGLLAMTVAVSFFDLGRLSLVVALMIAFAKAALIILFFMEVRYSKPLVWLFATAGFVWLLILLVIIMVDYTSRGWTGSNWHNATDEANHIEFSTTSSKDGSPRP